MAAEAVAMAIQQGDPDDLVFDIILTAGSNSMAIDKSCIAKIESNGASRVPSIGAVVQDLGFGRAPSFGRTGSNSSQRSTKWASALERLKSNSNIQHTEAYFSRLGAAEPMEGHGFLAKPLHPPFSLEADIALQNHPDAGVEGKIALFVLHPRRMHMGFIFDCAYRSEKGKVEILESERPSEIAIRMGDFADFGEFVAGNRCCVLREEVLGLACGPQLHLAASSSSLLFAGACMAAADLDR